MNIFEQMTRQRIDTFNHQVEQEIKYKLVMMTDKAYQLGNLELYHILRSVDLHDIRGLLSELDKHGYKLELYTPKYKIETSNIDEYYASYKLDAIRIKVTKTLFEV